MWPPWVGAGLSVPVRECPCPSVPGESPTQGGHAGPPLRSYFPIFISSAPRSSRSKKSVMRWKKWRMYGPTKACL